MIQTALLSMHCSQFFNDKSIKYVLKIMTHLEANFWNILRMVYDVNTVRLAWLMMLTYTPWWWTCMYSIINIGSNYIMARQSAKILCKLMCMCCAYTLGSPVPSNQRTLPSWHWGQRALLWRDVTSMTGHNLHSPTIIVHISSISSSPVVPAETGEGVDIVQG